MNPASTVPRPATRALALLLGGLLGVAGAEPGVPFAVDLETRRYDPAQITAADPVLAEIFAMARDVGFPVGTWGGASRDFLLGRGAPPPTSDVDLVYDSRALKRALFGDGVGGFLRRVGRIGKAYWRIVRVGGLGAVTRYTWLDVQRDGGPTMSVQKLMDSGAATLNQVGLLADGSVYDPHGGLQDAVDGVLRYRAPRPVAEMVAELDDIHNPSPADVLRAVRFKTQYPELEWAPGTLETLAEIMRLYAPGTEPAEAIAAAGKGVRGTLGKVVPDVLRKPAAGLKNMLGWQSYRDLRPYLEKNFQKVLANTADPRQALELYRELGLDRFAAHVGMDRYVRELEELALHAPTPTEPSPLPADPPLMEDPAASAELAESAWRKIADQAYRHYLAAQERGDDALASRQFRIYRQARERMGGTP